jgi:hypothetical protein
MIRRVGDRLDRILLPEATSAAEQWRRVVMNRAIDAHIAALDPPTRSAVEISGDSHARKPWREYTSLNYPDFDLCAPLEEQARFDVVICKQVLEHVIDSWRAAENLRGLAALDGHVIVSTPFLTSSRSSACTTTGASPRAGFARCWSAPASRLTPSRAGDIDAA